MDAHFAVYFQIQHLRHAPARRMAGSAQKWQEGVGVALTKQVGIARKHAPNDSRRRQLDRTSKGPTRCRPFACVTIRMDQSSSPSSSLELLFELLLELLLPFELLFEFELELLLELLFELELELEFELELELLFELELELEFEFEPPRLPRSSLPPRRVDELNLTSSP
jgi:hypothetical protein